MPSIELINMLSWVFAYIYVMTLGGPMNSTVVSEYYIYQQVFTNNVIGVGSAAGRGPASASSPS